jgi:hypothetical protein
MADGFSSGGIMKAPFEAEGASVALAVSISIRPEGLTYGMPEYLPVKYQSRTALHQAG